MRDVLARHLKLDLTACAAATGHFEQEGRHPLLCAQNQQQRVLVAAIKLASRDFPKLASHVAVPRCKCEHSAALEDQDGDIADRLGGRRMRIPRLEAEHVSRKVKRANLTASVNENLVHANCAAHDLVEIIGGLRLAVDLLVAGE